MNGAIGIVTAVGARRGELRVRFDEREVLDNLSTHKTPSVMRWLVRHPRFHLHFTPTHASWLNMVERFFGMLTQQALQRGSHDSVAQLRNAIGEFIDAHNESSRPFRWTKTADAILDSLSRFGRAKGFRI